MFGHNESCGFFNANLFFEELEFRWNAGRG